jgi:hypothetical protein
VEGPRSVFSNASGPAIGPTTRPGSRPLPGDTAAYSRGTPGLHPGVPPGYPGVRGTPGNPGGTPGFPRGAPGVPRVFVSLARCITRYVPFKADPDEIRAANWPTAHEAAVKRCTRGTAKPANIASRKATWGLGNRQQPPQPSRGHYLTKTAFCIQIPLPFVEKGLFHQKGGQLAYKKRPF